MSGRIEGEEIWFSERLYIVIRQFEDAGYDRKGRWCCFLFYARTAGQDPTYAHCMTGRTRFEVIDEAMQYIDASPRIRF